MAVFSSLDRIASLPWLDSALGRAEAPLHRLPMPIRDALHGIWLGHPLHPALAQTPIGFWTSAALLDVLGGLTPPGPARDQLEKTAGTLIAAGLISAPLAAASGLTDWSQLDRPRQRIGVVHAALNSAGVALVAASVIERRRGRSGRARWLSVAGAGVTGLAAGVGGHLSYRHAAGVNHAPDVPADIPALPERLVEGAGDPPDGSLDGRPDWTAVTGLDELSDSRPALGMLGDVSVVVVLRGDQVHVLAHTCSHLGGPLSQGEVVDDCIVCPWHGSAFRLTDGSVRHGPATAPQPTFQARLSDDGSVQARLLSLIP
ncbi:MAG: Rieske 2Fe-2S domain-containing protein [Kineosporiaceae bacterium]|nr:Rieske 2Fe-2S domain-containing protein [Kineosporiaceae bacterium]